MRIMKILQNNEELTQAVFFACCASIVGSAFWILLHI